MIDAAIEGGSVAELNHKNMTVALRVGRRNIKLVGGDGVPTREGTHYYSQLGVPPPAVYPYEQGLVNGKWIVGFDGKKHLVQRMTSDGKWATTKKGLDYFRYNKDTYQVLFPVRPAHPPKTVEEGRERDAVESRQGRSQVSTTLSDTTTISRGRSARSRALPQGLACRCSPPTKRKRTTSAPPEVSGCSSSKPSTPSTSSRERRANGKSSRTTPRRNGSTIRRVRFA